jgi:hypothetical protein
MWLSMTVAMVFGFVLGVCVGMEIAIECICRLP